MIVEGFVELAAIVALLYLSELIVYLPPGRVGIVLRGKGARLIHGLGLKSPWPWSAFYAVDDFHLQLGTLGAFAYSPHRIDSRKPLGFGRAYVDYKDIEAITVRERDVLIDGKVFIHAVSVRAAERIRRELEEVRRIPENKREKHLKKQLAELIDPARAVEVRDEDDEALGTLRIFATNQAAVLIAIVGLCIVGRVERWPIMLGMLGGSMLLTVVKFAFAHKKLVPRELASRIGHIVTYVLTPVGGIKSADFTTRDRLADVHTLAALRAFLPTAIAERHLTQMLRDLENPGADTWLDPDAKARAVQDEHRAMLTDLVKAIAPKPTAIAEAKDEGVVVRCPRCGAPYTRVVSECFDCGATIPAPTTASPQSP